VPSKPLSEKLSLKPGLRTFFKSVPAELRPALEAPGLEVAARFTGAFQRILFFTKTRKALDREFPKLKARLAEGGILWVAWPKGGGLGTDLKVREVIRIGYDHGLVESVNLSVDETWTALKFTWPKPGKVYKNSFGKLPRQG
jgi:hypothetical protein